MKMLVYGPRCHIFTNVFRKMPMVLYETGGINQIFNIVKIMIPFINLFRY